jgi:hypothetical protein
LWLLVVLPFLRRPRSILSLLLLLLLPLLLLLVLRLRLAFLLLRSLLRLRSWLRTGLLPRPELVRLVLIYLRPRLRRRCLPH